MTDDELSRAVRAVLPGLARWPLTVMCRRCRHTEERFVLLGADLADEVFTCPTHGRLDVTDWPRATKNVKSQHAVDRGERNLWVIHALPLADM